MTLAHSSNRPAARILLACAGMLATALTLAQTPPPPGPDHDRFKWRDEKNMLHYADVLPIEAARLGYEIVNPQGLVVRVVERAKTPEEQAAADAAKAAALIAKEKADAQARDDHQLLSAYPTEADLQHAQLQQLEMDIQSLKSANISLHSQEATLADLLSRAEEMEHASKPIPLFLNNQITELREQIASQRALIARKEQARQATIDRAAVEMAHYRDLSRTRKSPGREAPPSN
ncbi:MAG: hypothetical protein ABI451_11215 [Dokdonella sp.]